MIPNILAHEDGKATLKHYSQYSSTYYSLFIKSLILVYHIQNGRRQKASLFLGWGELYNALFIGMKTPGVLAVSESMGLLHSRMDVLIVLTPKEHWGFGPVTSGPFIIGILVRICMVAEGADMFWSPGSSAESWRRRRDRPAASARKQTGPTTRATPSRPGYEWR